MKKISRRSFLTALAVGGCAPVVKKVPRIFYSYNNSLHSPFLSNSPSVCPQRVSHHYSSFVSTVLIKEGEELRKRDVYNAFVLYRSLPVLRVTNNLLVNDEVKFAHFHSSMRKGFFVMRDRALSDLIKKFGNEDMLHIFNSFLEPTVVAERSRHNIVLKWNAFYFDRHERCFFIFPRMVELGVKGGFRVRGFRNDGDSVDHLEQLSEMFFELPFFPLFREGAVFMVVRDYSIFIPSQPNFSYSLGHEGKFRIIKLEGDDCSYFEASCVRDHLIAFPFYWDGKNRNIIKYYHKMWKTKNLPKQFKDLPLTLHVLAVLITFESSSCYADPVVLKY